ncbi:MAG: hypothetical protein ACXWFB_12565 [Nitrososphaeraceae archaeon]
MNLYKYYNNPEQLIAYEDRIKLVAEFAYSHANNEIGGPFPEGEAAIAKNASLSYRYARDVLEHPFPEGEKIISTDPILRTRYNRLFGTNI